MYFRNRNRNRNKYIKYSITITKKLLFFFISLIFIRFIQLKNNNIYVCIHRNRDRREICLNENETESNRKNEKLFSRNQKRSNNKK